jgi:thiol-disulfide isomerase/thioredoxin
MTHLLARPRRFLECMIAAGALTSLIACSGVEEPTTGRYRATLALPGGEAPFGFELARHEDGHVIHLVNGAERTEVRNVHIEKGELRATFPAYENRLRARIHKDALRGDVTLIKAGGKEQVIPFEAKLSDAPHFFSEPASEYANVQGRWALVLTSDDGEATQAVALFEQNQDRVTGTVMTPTGDHRYLEGQVYGNELKLSTFAGGLVYLYDLRVMGTAILQGEYWQGLAWHEKVAGQRNEQATLEGAEHVTTLKSQDAPFAFTFPDANGTPVSLTDDRFRGKTVVVTIGGSWCPNCHDEAKFLVPFYREYRDKGVEIVGLMFERHGEFDKAAAAVRIYQQDLDVEFPLLVAGVAENDDASKKLSALSGVYGYPTTILIDKQGKIRNVHTGFSGPATGKHYEEHIAEFTAEVDELLAEGGHLAVTE